MKATASWRAPGLALTESDDPLAPYVALPKASLRARVELHPVRAQIPPKSPKRRGRAGRGEEGRAPARLAQAALRRARHHCRRRNYLSAVPSGTTQETRPEGTGLAGLLVLLPKPNQLRFLPGAAEQHRDPARPEIGTCLRRHPPGQTSPAAGERPATPRGNKYLRPIRSLQNQRARRMRDGRPRLVLPGQSVSPSLCPSLPTPWSN